MFDWQTGEEQWASSDAPDVSQPEKPGKPTPPRISRRVLAGLGTLALLVLIVAGTLRWQADRGLARARADLQAAIDQEAWAVSTGNRTLFESLLDPQAPDGWRRQVTRTFENTRAEGITKIDIGDLALERPDLALVELTLQTNAGSMHRETRAYRQAGRAWLRTFAPSGRLWVHQQQLETENLRFIFHRADAGQVSEVAQPLQQLYTQLLHDFNLTPPANKRTLEVVISVRPANVGLDDPRLFDLSYLQEPDSATLLCGLGDRLAGRVLMAFANPAGDWELLLDAVRNRELSQGLPVCERDIYPRVAQIVAEHPFVPLSYLTPEHADVTPALLGETFIDYFVFRYGRDRLTDVTAGIARQTTWYDLAAYLDVDYVELTNGWWEFVIGKVRPHVPPGLGRPTSDPEDVWPAIDWMLELESQAIRSGDQQLFELLLDPEADGRWRRHVTREFATLAERQKPWWASVDRLKLDGDRAEVVVRVEGSAIGGVRPVFSTLELRSYRYTLGRWVRTAPSQ